MIALLETTIKSLELVQGTLRLADPGRSLDETGAATDRLGDVRDGASAGLSRSLSELRTALSEADLPEEAASRSIIGDARDLTAEIEARIDEGRREADAARRGRRDRTDGRDETRTTNEVNGDRDDRGVRIDVTDPDADREGENDGNGEADDSDDDPAPEVDVESELESIKRQIDDREADTAADAGDETVDTEGAAADAGGETTDADHDSADNGSSAGNERDDEPADGDDDDRDSV